MTIQVEKKEAFKAQCLKVINDVLKQISDYTSNIILRDDFGQNRLEVTILTEKDDKAIAFFKPWTQRRLSNHPINKSDPTAARMLGKQENSIDNGLEGLYPGYKWSPADRVEIIISYLRVRINKFPRCGTSGEEPQSLSHTTDWTFLARMRPLNDPGYQPKDPYKWGCDSAWEPRQTQHGPHLKALLYNVCNGHDEHLLVTEVLTILGHMKDRLEMEDYQYHVIAPILLFSISGSIRGSYGRVLEAYCDGNKIVIRKSGLYNFNGSDIEGSMQFFERYAAASVLRPTRVES